jgi:hypothetical protein
MSRSKRSRDHRSLGVPRRRHPDAVPAWALLSAALSHDNRLQTWRPDVDTAVQLAAEIALSDARKFQYNHD